MSSMTDRPFIPMDDRAADFGRMLENFKAKYDSLPLGAAQGIGWYIYVDGDPEVAVASGGTGRANAVLSAVCHLAAEMLRQTGDTSKELNALVAMLEVYGDAAHDVVDEEIAAAGR